MAFIVNRIQVGVNDEISSTKAAYLMQRSTTEHIFTCKLIKERTLSAEKKELIHLPLEMSSVFDSTSNKRPAAHR